MSVNHKVVIRRLAYVAYMGLGMLAAGEGLLRVVVDKDPAYYVAFSDPAPGTVVEYPYGEILYNSDGFADADFDAVKSRPRVGYVGDSVCFGVGAGYGYRVSELLEEAYPGYEHMNFTGGLGGGTTEALEKADVFSTQYDLDAVVYLMNLNDIRPEGKSEGLTKLRKNPLFRLVEWFRGRSYLYTYLRQILKDLRNPGGGPPSYEMFPDSYPEILAGTAERTDATGVLLRSRGVRFVVLIVPYEMQISSEAARVYSEVGTEWEDSFLFGRTQDILKEQLKECVVVDGIEGFLGPDRDISRRDEYAVGQTYVYNLGERLDWNHPNRLGHRFLADRVVEVGALDGLVD